MNATLREFTERARLELSIYPTKRFSLCEVRSWANVTLNGLDEETRFQISRLNFWFEQLDREGLIVNVSDELSHFRIAPTILTKYDLAHVCLSDMYFISARDLCNIVERETASSVVRSYANTLARIESIYDHEQKEALLKYVYNFNSPKEREYCLGSTMVILYKNRRPFIRIFIYNGLADYVIKKMNARASGQYITNRLLPIVAPHRILLPPICYESKRNICHDAHLELLRFKKLFIEANDECTSETFPIQFNYHYISFTVNKFCTLRDIQDVYLDEVKKDNFAYVSKRALDNLMKRGVARKAKSIEEQLLITLMDNTIGDFDMATFRDIPYQ